MTGSSTVGPTPTGPEALAVTTEDEHVVKEISALESGAAREPSLARRDVGREISLHREKMRGTIAARLLLLLAVLAVGALASVSLGLAPVDAIKDIVALIFAPLVSVFGAVTGFYYGASSSRS
jgi:hypothetical protein